MSSIQIEPITAEKAPQLSALSRLIFHDSFADQNSETDMQQYMDRAFNEEQLQRELNNPQSAFYFAVHDGEQVGYLKLNWEDAQTEFQHQGGLEIERIYLVRGAQGKGIAQQLIEFAIAKAQALEAKFIWLGVWEKNPKAIRFYEKNGFKIIGSHQFVLGSDVQTDLLMRKELING